MLQKEPGATPSLYLDTGGKKGGSITKEDCWEGDVQKAKPSEMSRSKTSTCGPVGRQVGRCAEDKTDKMGASKQYMKPQRKRESGGHSGALERGST